mmetsp:Transcript_23088/g.58534  ORF Transcript_23088/g.58534 Transcript_23088/m.58534 type:complete len:140 (+) Transcript_23088:216-635(+)
MGQILSRPFFSFSPVHVHLLILVCMQSGGHMYIHTCVRAPTQEKNGSALHYMLLSAHLQLTFVHPRPYLTYMHTYTYTHTSARMTLPHPFLRTALFIAFLLPLVCTLFRVLPFFFFSFHFFIRAFLRKHSNMNKHSKKK